MLGSARTSGPDNIDGLPSRARVIARIAGVSLRNLLSGYGPTLQSLALRRHHALVQTKLRLIGASGKGSGIGFNRLLALF